jgi:hypothetical protein
VNRGFAQFAGDIYPPPMPIHARHKLRLCAPKKLLNFLSKLYVGLFITLIIVVLCYFDYINTEEQITLTSIGSGLIAIIGLYFFYKRLKNQDIQRVDDRFNSAINLLGSRLSPNLS